MSFNCDACARLIVIIFIIIVINLSYDDVARVCFINMLRVMCLVSSHCSLPRSLRRARTVLRRSQLSQKTEANLIQEHIVVYTHTT